MHVDEAGRMVEYFKACPRHSMSLLIVLPPYSRHTKGEGA